MRGLTKKETITCLESNTNQLNMVDTTVSIISTIIISIDLNIQITRSAHKTQATVATQAVTIQEDVAKAIISTIIKEIAAIRTNSVVILLQEAKAAGHQALQITTPEITLNQTTEAVVAIITIKIME